MAGRHRGHRPSRHHDWWTFRLGGDHLPRYVLQRKRRQAALLYTDDFVCATNCPPTAKEGESCTGTIQ